MKLRFFNAKILTAPEADPFDGELRVEGGKIVYAGTRPDPSFCADREVDCGGDLLMSGLCNAHAHSAMCLFRGIADDLPLEEWLYDRIFPLEKYLTEEDVYWGTILQIAEYVRNGITCVADMYYCQNSVAAAMKNVKSAQIFTSSTKQWGCPAQGTSVELTRPFRCCP